MLFVHLDPLQFKLLEPVVGLALCLYQGVSLSLGHVQLNLEGFLQFDLSGSQTVLQAKLILAQLKGLLVQVSLTVLNTLPCLRLSYLEFSKLVLLQEF